MKGRRIRRRVFPLGRPIDRFGDETPIIAAIFSAREAFPRSPPDL